jgi:hypothetical protein
MRKSFLNLFTIVFLAVAFTTANTVLAQVRAYRVTDNQVRTVINRVETRTDNFKRQLDRSLDRSILNSTRTEDAINSFVADFERATDELKRNFDARRSTSAQVQEVLFRANFIENFMRRHRLNPNVQQQWILVRNDLNLLANYYNVSWTWGGTMITSPVASTRPYMVSDTQLESLLRRIEERTDVFKRQADRSLSPRRNNQRSDESLSRLIADFERSTDNLRRTFDARQSVATDAETVLMQARMIDTFMRDNRLAVNAQTQWNLLRNDLSTLASYYRLSWDWNAPSYPSGQFGSVLTGTYQLNFSQSDNVSNIIGTSVRPPYGTTGRDERLRRNLETRLTPPQMLVVEQRNNQITIASDLSPQVTFDADGVRRTETNPNGRMVNIRAANVGGGVEVSYEGDRTNDFYLTFMPLSNGQLRVTRRVHLEDRNQTITVNTVYDRVSQFADFSRVRGTTTAQNFPGGTVTNEFVVPNGTQLVANLISGFSTANANEGDRFTMEVRSPSQFNGAIIEGFVSNTQRSGRVSGRAEVTFNFDTIRLRNGQTYRFSGIIDGVRLPNGDNVSVNNEGAVRDQNQTTRTVTRAGIGAAIGAIIGAIAGGGQGAAIGAGVGAGAGAGTVILQGRDNLELQTGSEFRITASAPANMRADW